MTSAETLSRIFPPSMLTKSRPSTLDEVEAVIQSIYGIGRGEKFERHLFEVDACEKGAEAAGIASLAEIIARRISGKHNKACILLCFGSLGAGKSMFLLSLAVGISKWLSYLIGDTPEHYFNFEEGVAIIDPDSLVEKLSNLKRHQVVLLDDAGPGWDSRAGMSSDNRDINHVIQTCRVTNSAILISAPHTMQIDVTSRRTSDIFCEIAESHHDVGLTYIKTFVLVRDLRQNKIFFKYMTKGHATIVRHASGLPPAGMKKEYDIVRLEQAKAIMNRREERKKKELEREEKKKQKIENKEFIETMEKIIDTKEKITVVALAKKFGVDRGTIDRWMDKYGYLLHTSRGKTGGIVTKVEV